MTQRPDSQIHDVAAHLSRRDDIPQVSACHPRMHEAEARGPSQAAVHLQCRVQKGLEVVSSKRLFRHVVYKVHLTQLEAMSSFHKCVIKGSAGWYKMRERGNDFVKFS